MNVGSESVETTQFRPNLQYRMLNISNALPNIFVITAEAEILQDFQHRAPQTDLCGMIADIGSLQSLDVFGCNGRASENVFIGLEFSRDHFSSNGIEERLREFRLHVV